MATYENCKNVSVQVAVVASVAAATYCRFARWQGTNPAQREVVLHVPTLAAGAPAQGIVGMRPDAKGVVNGYATTSLVLPDGGLAIVELGEAVTVVGTPLRIGGLGAEIDGTAYKADAAGDIIVGYALETGAVGELISFQFVGYQGVV
jgi:hypothetical protein